MKNKHQVEKWAGNVLDTTMGENTIIPQAKANVRVKCIRERID